MQNSSGMNDAGGTSSGQPETAEPTQDRTATISDRMKKPYEAPRIERRIPVASNTMQGTSGDTQFFEDE